MAALSFLTVCGCCLGSPGSRGPERWMFDGTISPQRHHVCVCFPPTSSASPKRRAEHSLSVCRCTSPAGYASNSKNLSIPNFRCVWLRGNAIKIRTFPVGGGTKDYVCIFGYLHHRDGQQRVGFF
ncbi:hypothetical protein FPQ18DRAFT_335137 [Pyronema domesticum]|nr:hypothetical protein FPQ18DRAFT_335137 [Pyronema domesticum]